MYVYIYIFSLGQEDANILLFLTAPLVPLQPYTYLPMLSSRILDLIILKNNIFINKTYYIVYFCLCIITSSIPLLLSGFTFLNGEYSL